MQDPIAVLAVPDARKGERLIMVTTRVGATRAEVQKWMKDYGATELMHPSEIITLEALPLLGSGKTDYVELDRLVRSKLGLATGA
jgi:acyl-[acyl-carrier-protein]-phospholipid O-acyltransferase/long-chain-fatty-acid--[acyl-carrier-protein] ligase